MNHKISFIRKWNPSRDMVAIDQRGNRTQRGIYRHTWPTGSQELVFDTPADAVKYEAALNREPA